MYLTLDELNLVDILYNMLIIFKTVHYSDVILCIVLVLGDRRRNKDYIL